MFISLFLSALLCAIFGPFGFLFALFFIAIPAFMEGLEDLKEVNEK